MENPIKYYDNNIVGTLSLLKVMSNFNIKNIIFLVHAQHMESQSICLLI